MSDSTQFEVLGGVKIGEKAEMLREHAPIISEVGLSIPQTTVIASEALGEHKYWLDPDVDPRNFEVLKPAGPYLRYAMDRSSGSPFLVVRSSAAGDARGTGIYESKVARNRRKHLGKALGVVVNSFNSDKAVAFRDQADLGEEFAVMIQPVVGQPLSSYDQFGPPLSGLGYSSTQSKPDGYINVVAGIGGGVSRRGGEVITPDSIKNATENSHFEVACYSRWLEGFVEISTADSVALKTYLNVRNYEKIIGGSISDSDFMRGGTLFDFSGPNSINAMVCFQDIRGEPVRGSVVYPQDITYGGSETGILKMESALGQAMRLFKPGVLLETLADMERIAGYPLYVEWATRVTDGEIKPVIVQIAPVERKVLPPTETIHFTREYYRAYAVTGSGKKESSKIVFCWNPDDLEHLRDYDADPANDGYTLIYTSRLTSSISVHSHGQWLDFQDCSRAGVILEWQDAKHDVGSPIDHLRGAVDMTGKFFGVIDFDALDKNMVDLEQLESKREIWRSPRISQPGHGRLRISHGNFVIVADEESDQLFVGQV